MDISLAGRSAVITGASKGIGFAIASRFAASGADVAIIARGREALDEAVKTIGSRGGGRWRSHWASAGPPESPGLRPSLPVGSRSRNLRSALQPGPQGDSSILS